MEFELGSAKVAALAQRTKQSIETTARDERLAFFQRVAARRRCRTIFLAHQADDQVETFLLNLFRGAGGRGLGAMRERSTYGPLEIVRPLLGVWRAEIDDYIAEHGLKFREDATNEELHARRNRIRHKIVPWLEKEFGRNVRTNLWRAASILAEEEGLLDELLPNESENALVLEVSRLRELPVALQRRTIRRWLRGHEVSDVGFAVIERVRALLQPDAAVAKTNLRASGTRGGARAGSFSNNKSVARAILRGARAPRPLCHAPRGTPAVSTELFGGAPKRAGGAPALPGGGGTRPQSGSLREPLLSLTVTKI